jgi:hypothetical protein
LDPAKFKTTAEKGLEDEALEGNLYYAISNVWFSSIFICEILLLHLVTNFKALL